MTGFARHQGHDDACGWTWEIKSVNNRGYDLRLRLPAGFDALEPEIRRHAGERIARGSVAATLVVKRAPGAEAVRLNRPLLESVIALTADLPAGAGFAPPRIDGLLAIPGMIEPLEEDEATVERRLAAIAQGFAEAVEALVAERRAEGARLEPVLAARIDEIEALVADAEASAAAQPEALRARLARQVADLLGAAPALPEERLMQEAALLATKGDVREELDRLRAHVEAARGLLGEDGAVGRRLDFLCQEFVREANTLCSKSSDKELTRIGLALKAAIDRLREQIQNIE